MSLVLFDLDGTLVDSRAGIVTAVNATLRSLGEPVRPARELERGIGPPLHETFGALLAHRRLDAAALDAVVEDYRARYAVGMVAGSLVYPGIPELLDALRAAGITLAVATSKARPLARALLEGLGLAGRFAAIEGPVPPARDDKATTVGRALAAVGPLGGPATMVGDRHHDVEGALAHGLRPVGVAWGFGSREELLGAGADVVARDPGELLALLVAPRAVR